MATPIKYNNIQLYTTYNLESADLRIFLDQFRIKYANMSYPTLDDEQSCLDALNTWFPEKTFAGFPIIIFDKVYWISPDGEEIYAKRSWATAINELPKDFLAKTPKIG